MPDQRSTAAAWKYQPKETVTITNASSQNISLQLPTGRFRLDIGRSQMVDASMLDLPTVKELVNAGMIKVARTTGR